MANKVAVFGASGFVGSALCERLFFDGHHEFVAFVRSFGNAASIARFPINIRAIDLLDYAQIEEELDGCDVVVNCTRGSSRVMLDGLKNLAKAARKHRVKKLVHIGSISIYGAGHPYPSVIDEAIAPNPDSGYGRMKLEQDNILFRLHKSGVPSLVLCASNIWGPNSPYTLKLAQRVQAGQLALVDDGKSPVNMVHIYNLVQAILSAFESDTGWGERHFVNDTEQTEWKIFYADMQNMLGQHADLESVPRETALAALSPPEKQKATIKENFKGLMSGESRQALLVIPAFRSMNAFALNRFNSFSPKLQSRIRRRLEKPTILKQASPGTYLAPDIITPQMRQHYFSPEQLRKRLGYRPVIDYEQGMSTVRSWLSFAGMIPAEGHDDGRSS